jgi:hypothetical protein
MKIAMLALLLLVASAVVLIFANTLNSWVLGGLIGGLAALLISIPISLIIFATLSRRHDQLLFAQIAEQEELEAFDNGDYAGVYEAEAYVLTEEDDLYYEDDRYYDDEYEQYEDARLYPVQEARRLPAPGQGYASSMYAAGQRPVDQPRGYRRTTRNLDPAGMQEPERVARQPAQPVRFSQSRQQHTGHQRQPRSTQTTRSLRSQQQAAALRAALREAEQDHVDTYGMSTAPRRTATPRRVPSQANQASRLHRSEREQLDGAHQSYDAADPQTSDMDVDQPRGYNPITGPVNWNPDTGKIVRNPQVGEEYAPSEDWSGSLNNPIVRRAPYLYEDDPLREHFAQQVDKPIARRSSRYLQPLEEEE